MKIEGLDSGGIEESFDRTKPVVQARELVRRFGDFVAVDKTSFEVYPGDIFGLLSPNGAGKTTTFKMLCGLLTVSDGELKVTGINVKDAREEARMRLGYMSQKFALYGELSVKQNMEFFAGAYGLFGKAAKEKPMTGHHLGLYASLFTYDFEVGGKGQIGGVPGGTLWDEMNYMGGLEYGYSLPIARRFNIDFTLGVGYIGGKYYEYTPIDGHYVWQATKRRHFFGPTKLEVSLVWLIGYGNYNSKKGGRR